MNVSQGGATVRVARAPNLMVVVVHQAGDVSLEIDHCEPAVPGNKSRLKPGIQIDPSSARSATARRVRRCHHRAGTDVAIGIGGHHNGSVPQSFLRVADFQFHWLAPVADGRTEAVA